jgi:hypothetical protein
MFVRVAACLSILALAAGFAARTSGGSGRGHVYVVKQYDTLWSIATEHYSGDPREGIWRIERRNGFGDALIRPGQHIVLPP